ncbi:hypothetical protein P5673_033344 [Acropora cervicornis]|uniref:Uncharacterized protein n=1 Tax=Acropora cervicornis TaxID=6130 RepID=A0AAD9PQ24_ACRCE|nr:hypothetical protein P5673_033344 [Acropora cervicornis]
MVSVIYVVLASRAKTEKVIPTKEQIKRTLKRISNECDNLKDLGVKCLFISDNDGTGTMEVYGHPSAVRFAESSQLAAKFFAFVNGEGPCEEHTIRKYCKQEAHIIQQQQESRFIRRFTLEVQSFLPEFWPEFNHRNTRMASYVLSVLIPEAIVYVMTIREGCSRHSVERLLGTLENEINTQEEETDEDD